MKSNIFIRAVAQFNLHMFALLLIWLLILVDQSEMRAISDKEDHDCL